MKQLLSIMLFACLCSSGLLFSADAGDEKEKPVQSSGKDSVGRYQAMEIYGKPAVLDTATGNLVVINPDLSTIRIDIKSSGTTASPSQDASDTKASATKVAMVEIPAKITARIRRDSEMAIAKYGMNIGQICIADVRKNGVVATVELRNNGRRNIRAIELTFRGGDAEGNIEIQRIYLTGDDDEHGLIPGIGEFKSAEVSLGKMTTIDLEMEISYLLLDEPGADSSTKKEMASQPRTEKKAATNP